MIKLSLEHLNVLWLVLLFVFGEVISSDVAFILAVVTYMWRVLVNPSKIRFPYGVELLLTIVLIGAGIGFFGKYNTRDYIRDIYKTLGPVFFLLVGYMYGEKKLFKIKNMVSAVTVAGLGIGLYALLCKITTIVKYGMSFDGIRGAGGNASPVIIVAFAMLFFLPDDCMPKWIIRNKKIILTFFSVMNLLYLSRSVLIIWIPFIAMYIIMYGNKVRGARLFFKILFAVLLILTLTPKSVLDPFMEKMIRALQEINHKDYSWSWAEINNNWRGYEKYVINKEFENAGFLTRMFGFGFGKLVGLQQSINLGGEYFTSIGVFHDGYYYVYLKCGIFGVVCYILHLLMNLFYYIKRLKSKKCLNYDLFQLCMVIAFATSCYFIAGIYNGAYLISFCVVYGFMGNENVRRKMIRND